MCEKSQPNVTQMSQDYQKASGKKKCNLNPQITRDLWHLASSDAGAGASNGARLREVGTRDAEGVRG